MDIWKSAAWIALRDKAVRAIKQNILNIKLAAPEQARSINTLAIEQLRLEVEQLRNQKDNPT